MGQCFSTENQYNQLTDKNTQSLSTPIINCCQVLQECLTICFICDFLKV